LQPNLDQSPAEYISIASIVATLAGVVVTWLVMKHQFQSKRLSYTADIEPILRRSDPELIFDLKVMFKGEELLRPTLLNLDIGNTGHTAVEDAKIVVRLPGTTYLVPGYFLNLPAGYSELWTIVPTDAEECVIHLKHINPKQIARVRLLMDETPNGAPQVVCPMPNVQFVRVEDIQLSGFARVLARVFIPQLTQAIRLFR
jgi:hypothetical protein